MKNETIARIISGINHGAMGKRVFLFPGTGPVRRGLVWPELPDRELARGYTFWFLFDGEKCVGAIMPNGDLHAYVTPRYRRRGLTRNALVNVVFPLMAAKGETRLNVTVHSPEGRRLWESIGGQCDEAGRRGVIDLTKFRGQEQPDLDPKLPSLTDDGREAVRASIKTAARLLRFAADALSVVDTQSATTSERVAGLAAELEDAALDLLDRTTP